MALLICKIDKQLIIPPKMRGMPNEKKLVIDLKAGTPAEVPDYVASFYVKNYPAVYRYANIPVEPDEDLPKAPITKHTFNPLQFLELNLLNIEDALKPLQKEDLVKLANLLNLKGSHMQQPERIRERIVQDIIIKQRQQEELDKHKTAEG